MTDSVTVEIAALRELLETQFKRLEDITLVRLDALQQNDERQDQRITSNERQLDKLKNGLLILGAIVVFGEFPGIIEIVKGLLS